MAEYTLERLRRQLDSETQSPTIVSLPNDFYTRLATHNQKLRRAAGSGASEATAHLIAVQVKMIESMTRDLLVLRTKKAIRQNALLQLLPEERYVCLAQQKFNRLMDDFVGAVSSGQPSFIEFAHRNESSRSIIVRFTKHVNELVGLDFRRYGPFEAEDVASIPAASADLLVASGDAIEVHTRGT